jgi:5'-deoxynucleotidase YfbR-like HD superfamily hydrolase
MSWNGSKLSAVKVLVGPTIMLQSGAWLDFCAPQESCFTIEDIAHGLSNICRYAGQCTRFYSVAEHSLLVSETAIGFPYEALMHDAAEAFLGDVTRPLKQMLPDFKRIEAEVERAIYARFGLAFPVPPEVKQADLRVLAAEQKQIMPKDTDWWVQAQQVEPAPITIRNLAPDAAKAAFLERFHQLRKERGTSSNNSTGCALTRVGVY